MIGIVLAGGSGTRLWPLTAAVSKQLLPVYNKPLIYFPISTLMNAGIREIVIITTDDSRNSFEKLLGSGEQFGVEFHYEIQKTPAGIAEAFLIAERHIAGRKVALILGDNLFYGTGLGHQLSHNLQVEGAKIFAYWVSDPERYGVIQFDKNGTAQNIVEKPAEHISSYAIPGLYFYDESVLSKAKNLRPSERGELEISDINLMYLGESALNVEILPRGTAWLDTGTFESLHDATSLIKTIEERQGLRVACLEEIAFRNHWISRMQLQNLVANLKNLDLAEYLQNVLNEQN